jgi:hypothetical protein
MHAQSAEYNIQLLDARGLDRVHVFLANLEAQKIPKNPYVAAQQGCQLYIKSIVPSLSIYFHAYMDKGACTCTGGSRQVHLYTKQLMSDPPIPA